MNPLVYTLERLAKVWYFGSKLVGPKLGAQGRIYTSFIMRENSMLLPSCTELQPSDLIKGMFQENRQIHLYRHFKSCRVEKNSCRTVTNVRYTVRPVTVR